MPKKATRKSRERGAKARRSPRRVKNQRTDMELLNELEEWLRAGDSDDLLKLRFDPKSKLLWADDHSGTDLRSVLDNLLEFELSANMFLCNLTATELKGLVRDAEKETRANPKEGGPSADTRGTPGQKESGAVRRRKKRSPTHLDKSKSRSGA